MSVIPGFWFRTDAPHAGESRRIETMSSLIVEVVRIEEVKPHPNADRLNLARIKGWQVVIAKRGDGPSQFVQGEKVVYIPPDSVLPREMAERLGVLEYLAERTDIAGDRVLVVKRVRLRGEPSFGLVVAPDDPGWEIGRDVKDHYQIEKYLPSARPTEGDAEKEHHLFERYTDVENMRHFPTAFEEGEEVVVTENKYWHAYSLFSVRDLFADLHPVHGQVILFGEVYGAKIQKRLPYGHQESLGFAAFDLFSLDVAREKSSGRSIVIGADNIREGVVVRPVAERTDPKIGRLILKYVNDDYLMDKKLTDADVTDV